MKRLRRAIVGLAAVVALVYWADHRLFHADERPAAASEPLEAEAPDSAPALECEKALAARRAQAKAEPRGPRVGSWNIRWFPRGTARGDDAERRTDVAWLACAIAELDVDVLAVQEVLDDPEARAAALALTARLDRLTGGRWKVELDACKGSGRQHVGFLWNGKKVTLDEIEPLADVNPGKSACDLSLRPGLVAYARFEEGPDLHLLSVHLDSGQESRDYEHRRTSVERLKAAHARLSTSATDDDLLVLGDWNAMGCSKCTPQISATEEIATLDGQLRSAGLERVGTPPGLACTHYYGGRPGLLDLIVRTSRMQEALKRAHAEPLGACSDLACKRVTRSQRPPALERLSDHCPVVLELSVFDLDQ